jgi:hypothetical protein
MLLLSVLLPLFIWAALVWLAYTCHVFLKQRSCAQQNGCKESTKISQESFIGYAMIRESFDAFKNSKYLQIGKERFDELGDTFTFRQLGKLGVNTNDPINVKAILSSQFHDFGVGQKRSKVFDPLIGHGILTADGYSWEKARKLVRPSFAKGYVDDAGYSTTNQPQPLAADWLVAYVTSAQIGWLAGCKRGCLDWLN